MWQSWTRRSDVRSLMKILTCSGIAGSYIHEKLGEGSKCPIFKPLNMHCETKLTKWKEEWRHLRFHQACAFCEAGRSPDSRIGDNDLRPISLRDGAASFADGAVSITSESTNTYAKGSTGEPITRYSIADAAAKAAPAVVHITVTLGDLGLFAGEGAGSGVLIHSNGTILTNAHVVAGYGSVVYKGKVKVSLQDGRTFDGEVVSFDLSSDIAVVKINSKTPLPAASLGSSRKLRPGEWIIALGSPLHLQNSVTVGVVSCVERKGSEMGLRGVHGAYIQTDAAINQGNSGGPLLNLDGEVVGINTMKAYAADGVSFAIPIDTAIKVMEQLQKHGRVIRPWLGIKMLELNQHVLSQLKEQDPAFPDVAEGILVPQVIPGSPAERAGIRAGDVITHFDGIPITKTNQIIDILGDKVGISYKVIVRRSHNKQATLMVTTEEARANY
ncbi:hypothetical protein KP509_12G028400 [Ceratopteris richardii]|uniref:PDZ domain-containing protein n=1 Tax=Ceratopteris richardii TaxID=49495 RepID=A0A8T2THJ7_CERRI|nr:hypothetical protein KP509_12G028400 [Ceratopteris richardii]KAH7422842.1 hypothetical protein KP509_12G028400 [Ceratopteris richardii]KAH7422843.1 hypothetical protein KP509_12G028400 [Ceratopteris richardii]